METVRGTCRDGTPRQLSFWLKGGRLCLWMHRPDSGEKEGLEMIVAPDDLFAALARALVGKRARDPGDQGAVLRLGRGKVKPAEDERKCLKCGKPFDAAGEPAMAGPYCEECVEG